MSGSLESYVGQPVIIVSCDGRCFSGTLKGKFNLNSLRRMNGKQLVKCVNITYY